MIENLTTKARDRVLKALDLEQLLTVTIGERLESDHPSHSGVALAHLRNDLQIHVVDGASHLGEERQVVIDYAYLRPSGTIHLRARIPEEMRFDHGSLIEAALAAHKSYGHEDFSNYYNGLVDVMQELLGLRLDKPTRADDLLRLFYSTIQSYHQICSPFSGWMEAGIQCRILDEAGEDGKAVMSLYGRICNLNIEKKKMHVDMLVKMFEIMFGPCKEVFNYYDLLARGFDSTAEPRESDYYDYLY